MSVEEKTFDSGMYYGLCYCTLIKEAATMRRPFPNLDTEWTPVKLRTRKEAADMLEGLRRAYQSLALDERNEVKRSMGKLAESQRRFGTPCFDITNSISDQRMIG